MKKHETAIKEHTPDPKSGNNRKHPPRPSPSHKDPSWGFFRYLSTAPNGSGVEGAGHPSGASESLQFYLSGSMARHLPTPGATSPLRDSRGVAGGLVATGQVLALQKASHCWQTTLTVYIIPRAHFRLVSKSTSPKFGQILVQLIFTFSTTTWWGRFCMVPLVYNCAMSAMLLPNPQYQPLSSVP